MQNFNSSIVRSESGEPASEGNDVPKIIMNASDQAKNSIIQTLKPVEKDSQGFWSGLWNKIKRNPIKTSLLASLAAAGAGYAAPKLKHQLKTRMHINQHKKNREWLAENMDKPMSLDDDRYNIHTSPMPIESDLNKLGPVDWLRLWNRRKQNPYDETLYSLY